MKKNILSFIRTGAENGIHLQELINLTGLKNRELRRSIEHFRRSGIVIISDKHGYYYPKSEAELRSYIKQEQARSRSINKTLRTAKKEYEKMTSGQVQIEYEII